jgi:hypothetical protein
MTDDRQLGIWHLNTILLAAWGFGNDSFCHYSIGLDFSVPYEVSLWVAELVLVTEQ